MAKHTTIHSSSFNYIQGFGSKDTATPFLETDKSMYALIDVSRECIQVSCISKYPMTFNGSNGTK
jgi:hypothetical protein